MVHKYLLSWQHTEAEHKTLHAEGYYLDTNPSQI